MNNEYKGQDFLKEQPYAYWLAGINGIGNKTKILLTDYAGTPKAVFQMEEHEYDQLVPKAKRIKIMNAKKKGDILEAYRKFEKKNIHFIPITHPLYPERLKKIADPPYGIYVEGELPEEGVPAVAVIGARQCSEYGRIMAAKCGRELADEGIHVVSGMARGIDGICQNAVLEAGGRTYAVLGCGTNVCYPNENRNIYRMIKEKGAVISEYAPDTQPKPQLFPPRNRIISGLADLVLIVEARERSGTLITADMALEQGKEVYVIPGRVTDILSEGCIRLSKQGAGIMTSVKEMLEETGLADPCRNAGRIQPIIAHHEAMGQEMTEGKKEKLVLQALDYYPKSVEKLQCETKLLYRDVLFSLVNLCIEGRAEQISAGQYVRKI